MHEHPLHRFFKSRREQPVFQWERFQQRDVLVIDQPHCQAVFSRQGAQLLHFKPTGQKPWLWCAEKWPQVGAIRGGVPICWPWFGNLALNPPSVQAMRVNTEPATAHGLVRTREWELHDYDDAGEALHIALGLPHIEGGLPGWPHDVALTLNIRLDSQLHISLTSHNRSSIPVSISQAPSSRTRLNR